MCRMPGSSDQRTAISLPSERPGASGKPILVVIAGPELGRRIDLDGGEVDIGRDDGVTFRIDSDLVSRRHASIRRVAGKLAIADLGSTNGTFVNDVRIKTHTLADGDQIKIGKVVLKFTMSAVEAQYHEQIVLLASMDALTGAYNKRYFEEALRKAFGPTHGTTVPLSLILFDIDHFKKINDTWGHAAGDAVLRQVTDIVRGQVRNRDVFCRVGGEEFALLLDGASLADARRAAELVRRTIEMTAFTFEGKRIPVTVSLGAAERLPPDSSPESLYRRADARLYEAKRSGRNRVC